MYTICLLVLLASLEYKCVQAAGIPFSTRQSSTAVELWEACNYPSQGINGPLPCSSGECICKDDSTCSSYTILLTTRTLASKVCAKLTWDTAYAQCREQIGGSWAPEPTWQCQQPGGSATGTSPSTDDTSSIASKAKLSGNSVGSVGDSLEAAAPNTLSLDTSSSGTGSQQAATIGGCDSTNAPAGWDGVASTSVSL